MRVAYFLKNYYTSFCEEFAEYFYNRPETKGSYYIYLSRSLLYKFVVREKKGEKENCWWKYHRTKTSPRWNKNVHVWETAGTWYRLLESPVPLALSFGWQTVNTSGRNFRATIVANGGKATGDQRALQAHRFWYICYDDRAKWRPACKNQIASPLIEVNYLHGNGDNLLLQDNASVY